MVQYFFGRWCDLPYKLRNVTKSSISDSVVDDIFIHCLITIYSFIRSDNN